jgi:hypothetical protein
MTPDDGEEFTPPKFTEIIGGMFRSNKPKSRPAKKASWATAKENDDNEDGDLGDNPDVDTDTDTDSDTTPVESGPKPRVAGQSTAGQPAGYFGDEILPQPKRRAAMDTLDAQEIKFASAGLIIALILAGISFFLINDAKPTKKTVLRGGHKVTELVPLSPNLVFLVVAVVVITALAYLALRKRKRTLLAFGFFLIGLGYAEVFVPIGLALIVLGGWLLLRAYRINKYGNPSAKVVARQAATRPRGPREPRARRERGTSSRSTSPTKAGAPKPTVANKRYTPKSAPRKKVIKPTD